MERAPRRQDERDTDAYNHKAATLRWRGLLEMSLVQVQLTANLNGWSTEETGVQVTLTLEGTVLQVLMDLPP